MLIALIGGGQGTAADDVAELRRASPPTRASCGHSHGETLQRIPKGRSWNMRSTRLSR
jgi:hypothetical protein